MCPAEPAAGHASAVSVASWKCLLPAFSVSASWDDFTKHHSSCLGGNTGCFSWLMLDGRDLAALYDAGAPSLFRMPDLEPAVASLIVFPEETLLVTELCKPSCLGNTAVGYTYIFRRVPRFSWP